MKLFAFPKNFRLRKRIEFEQLKTTGLRVHNSLFIVTYAQRFNTDASRLGITVTRKIGNAVARNRIKRLIREFFRKNKHRLTRSCDLNIIAKQRIRYHTTIERVDAIEDIFNLLASALSKGY
ncbi:MAG: ribonuclease P protein component [Candidatus Magnetomorum sp.]|nr:ribonuclease P protein component [Candidatus Magnetomorum sp.]